MRRIAPYQRDTDSWVQNAGWQPYMQVLRSAVMLAKESDLVKVEQSRGQSRMEPITYLNAYIALADLAYGQQLVLKTLVDEVISGVNNPLLKNESAKPILLTARSS